MDRVRVTVSVTVRISFSKVVGLGYKLHLKCG